MFDMCIVSFNMSISSLSYKHAVHYVLGQKNLFVKDQIPHYESSSLFEIFVLKLKSLLNLISRERKENILNKIQSIGQMCRPYHLMYCTIVCHGGKRCADRRSHVKNKVFSDALLAQVQWVPRNPSISRVEIPNLSIL